ncbi:MAG TPA: 2TM domain-containing protein [Bacteroidales bacterium]|jgi:uncharacterized Tic20 family protein|nr:2TM domain-containing protein [Bacteroidales bacterium]HOF16780.1 2TM domain-containing protein [Bacteroidales bacterium]HON21205.1 2TM domain-containing protein [Bacteroidales bacterium]HOR82607.1 2TM domain-containing protein [Bacteroidales bacterium]HPJ92221.1 2TM domain-containing protein [Bacteroidales bacterium]
MENKDTLNILSEQKDDEKKLYKIAKKRAAFRIHLSIYLLVILFFWLIWYFLFAGKEDNTFLLLTLAITLFWLLFIIAHYLFAFKWNKSIVEKEIKRLEKKEKKLEALKEKLNQNENLS